MDNPNLYLALYSFFYFYRNVIFFFFSFFKEIKRECYHYISELCNILQSLAFKIWLVNSRKVFLSHLAIVLFYGTNGRWLLRLHHIPGSSSHEDCNCNFWKSQKPIEGCVWVQSFQAPVRAGGTHGLTQLYHGAWDNDCHTRVPFFFPQKKKKQKSYCSLL